MGPIEDPWKDYALMSTAAVVLVFGSLMLVSHSRNSRSFPPPMARLADDEADPAEANPSEEPGGVREVNRARGEAAHEGDEEDHEVLPA
jgi:hypothetical protein